MEPGRQFIRLLSAACTGVKLHVSNNLSYHPPFLKIKVAASVHVSFMVRQQPRHVGRGPKHGTLGKCLDRHVGQTHGRTTGESAGLPPVLWLWGPRKQHSARRATSALPPAPQEVSTSLVLGFRGRNRLTKSLRNSPKNAQLGPRPPMPCNPGDLTPRKTSGAHRPDLEALFRGRMPCCGELQAQHLLCKQTLFAEACDMQSALLTTERCLLVERTAVPMTPGDAVFARARWSAPSSKELHSAAEDLRRQPCAGRDFRWAGGLAAAWPQGRSCSRDPVWRSGSEGL